MSSRRPSRSASVGAIPREKKHFTSRNESASGLSLDVRCACQFFGNDSLLPERVNPAGSRPGSKIGFHPETHPHLLHDNISQQSFQMSGNFPIDPDTLSRRGLVVRSISDASEPDIKSREMSVDRFSIHSRDPDTMSVRSGISLRKVTNSNQNLYVADLNIPTSRKPLTRTQVPQYNVAVPPPVQRIQPTFHPQARILPQHMPIQVDQTYHENITEPTMDSFQPSDHILAASLKEITNIAMLKDVTNIDPAVQLETKIEIKHMAPAIKTVQQMEVQHPQPMDTLKIPTENQLKRQMEDRSQSPERKRMASEEPPQQDVRLTNGDSADHQPVTNGTRRPSKFNIFRREGSPMPKDLSLERRPSKLASMFKRDKSPIKETSPKALPEKPSRIKKMFRREKETSPAPTNVQLERRPSKIMSMFKKESTPTMLPTTLERRPSKVLSMFKKEKSPIPDVVVSSASVVDESIGKNGRRSSRVFSMFKREKSPVPMEITETSAPTERRSRSPLPAPRGSFRRRSPAPMESRLSPDSAASFQMNVIPATPDIQLSSSPPTLERRPSKRFSMFRREKSPVPMDTNEPERRGSRVFSMFKRDKTPGREMSPARERSPVIERAREKTPEPNGTKSKGFSMFKRDKTPAREMTPGKERSPVIERAREKTPEPNGTKSKGFSMFKRDKTPAREMTPGKERSPVIERAREKTPEPNGTKSKGFSMFKRDKTPAREMTPAREKSVTREKTPDPDGGKSKGFSMSMFKREKSPAVEREKSPEDRRLQRERSPGIEQRERRVSTAMREASPSFFSNLFKSKKEDVTTLAAQEVQMVSSMKSKKAPEMMSVKVIETFSLKVDDMDQYNVVPKSQPSTPQRSGQASVNASLDWSKKAPSHSSHISLTSTGKKLVSIPTGLQKTEGDEDMQSEVFSVHSMKSQSIDINDAFRPVILNRRTQSQDRGQTEEDLISSRMSKTVSFDFATSQDSEQNLTKAHRSCLSEQEIEQADWLERTYYSRDHEYEPIGDPETQKIPDEKPKSTTLNLTIPAEKPIEAPKEEPTTPEEMKDVRQFQQDVEDKYFSSTATTPRSESRTDYIHTSQVDSSALEELPLKQENRTKKFMTSAQDRGRRMKAGISNQAGKIKTKIRSLKKPPRSPKGSPKAKERKRFKAPDFSKIKMPDMPDMSRFKDMKPKFSKPDMSKFKMPDKFSSLKLKRSKSMKEPSEEDEVTEQTEVTSPSKKKFEFSFGTYPRALRRTKTKEDSVEVIPPTETPSIMTTETAPSIESSPPPMGDRGPGPVRSRWADKFSDTSYIAGSDTSRLQRLESSEQESFDRESSLERRMAEALDRADKEDEEMRIISGAEEKQFADFDEENRAIHELTQFRAGELKRRTLVHQDSDLVSEESKDVGWSERDILKNRILKHAEIDTDAYMGYPSEEHLSVNTNQETQSTASSAARKLVIEEIDDDEFFIRKRGISQDNIEIRQYISSAIREGFENPENALAKVGGGDYGYDLPPRKPKRVKNFDDYDAQEDNLSLPHGNGRFYNSMPPSRPLRKGKMYSSGSQEVPNMDEPTEDMDETDRSFYDNASAPGATLAHSPPKAPKRRKRGNFRETKSMEKDAYLNGFGGRSVSNSYIEHENENQRDDMIVYRTQHNYIIPLATPERFTDGTPTPRKSRSQSHLDEDRTSRGIESLMTDNLDNELDDSIMADDSLANEKFTIEMKDGDGYAVVRKESQMPKPTPPARRKKYNNRLTDDRFATMPHLRRDNVDEDEEELPERPVRGYSTIGPPKPPRRKSLTAEDTQKSNPDISEYEELKIADDPSRRPESPRNLEDMFHKMKYRPLPPPPRPPRDRASKKSSKGYGDDDDRDGGGERLRILETIMSATESDTATEGNVVEVEVSTQTDPLPDDFVCEEFEITEDMKVIHARPRSRTVEDILREELEAEEFERVKMQLADDDTLTTGINKFRDSNQRTYSERSRGSSHLSRPQTPSAILIERRIPTPVSNGSHNSVLLEASLIVRPLEEEFLTSGDEVRSGDELKSGDELRSDEEELITTDDDLLAAEEELLAAEAELRKAEEEAMRQHMSISPLPSRFSIVPIDDEIEAIQERFNISPIETIHQDFDISPRESDVEMELHPSDYPTDERIEEMLKEIRRANEMVLEEEEKKLAVEEERRIVEEEVDNFNVEERHASPPAPQPPPRRRNSGMTPEISEVVSQITSPQDSQQPPPPPPPPSIQQAVVESTLPTRMTLSDLEVERLRVHALQAGQIMVSELQGVQVNADEFNCRSGNLVVRNIDLPPGFIEEIVERVRATERDHIQIPVETQTSPSIERLSITHSQETQTKDTEPVKEEPIKEQREPLKESPPERPPAPQTDYSYPAPPVPQNTIDYSYSVPPPSFYQLRNPDEDLPLIPPRPPYFPPPEFFQSIAPQSFYQLRNPGETDEEYEERMTRRRRHLHHHRRRDSSSGREEDEHRRHRSKSRQRHEQPQSVSQAGRELISACNASLVRRMNALASYLRNPEKSDRTMGTLTLIFILLTIGFLILAVMGHDIHHHHWDFFNLPENNGRS
ncbi:hypothetical protein ACFFRR_010711 [Megaselia abdita]